MNASWPHGASLLVVLALACSACGDDTTPGSGSSGGGEAAGTDDDGSSTDDGGGGDAPGASPNVVDLTISGDVTAVLQGNAGTCGGIDGGASFTVLSSELGVSPELELAVVILGESDWDAPPTVLNLKEGDRTSYVWNRTEGTVVAQRDRSRVDLDVELRSVVGTETVRVVGSIVCND